MNVVWLLLLLLLTSQVYATNGEGFNSLEQLSNEDALMFAKAICDIEQDCRYGEDGESFTIFVEFAQSSFQPHSVIYGHFSQADILEAYVHMLPLEAEPPGRGVLFRFEEDTWRYIETGDAPWQACGTILGYPGKDYLLCYWDAGTRITDPFVYDELDGSRFVMNIFDFGKAKVDHSELFSFSNNIYIFCDERATRSPVRYYALSSFSQNDVDTNGYPDVVLELEETQFDRNHCYERETGVLNETNDSVLHELTWLFDGEVFTPTPETQAFLDSLQN